MEKRRNALGVYDLPLWRDWLAWVTLVAVIAVLGQPTVIDLVIGVLFQVFLFGFIPGKIRQAVRRRQAQPAKR